MVMILCSTVEVCVFRVKNDLPEFLVLQRSADAKLYPNLWQCVSGSIREGETGVQAAVREVREETGLNARRLWVTPHTNTFYDHADNAVHVSPLFAAQVSAEGEPRLSEEHCHYRWLHSAAARALLVWPGQKEGVNVVENLIMHGGEAGDRKEVRLDESGEPC